MIQPATALGRTRPTPARVVSASCRAGARTVWPSLRGSRRRSETTTRPGQIGPILTRASLPPRFTLFFFRESNAPEIGIGAIGDRGASGVDPTRCRRPDTKEDEGLVWRRCAQDGRQNTKTLRASSTLRVGLSGRFFSRPCATPARPPARRRSDPATPPEVVDFCRGRPGGRGRRFLADFPSCPGGGFRNVRHEPRVVDPAGKAAAGAARLLRTADPPAIVGGGRGRGPAASAVGGGRR